MLGYKYITEESVISEQQRLKSILGLDKNNDLVIVTFFEHFDECWYIVYTELIAPHMPEPIEIIFNVPENDIVIDETLQPVE